MKEENIRALMVAPGNRPVPTLLKNELDALQQAVSIGTSRKGLIEVLYPEPGVCLVCNEEGKLLRMEYNRALYDESGTIYDIICGPFFVCSLGAEDFTSLAERLTDKYYKYFERPELFVRVGCNLIVMRA